MARRTSWVPRRRDPAPPLTAVTGSGSDPLTGLLGRDALAAVTARAVDRAVTHGSRLALLTLDVHRFGELNDRWGTGVGDVVLRTVAARLTAVLRTTDVAARTGPDEFTVLLPTIHDAGEAARVARRVLDELAAPITTPRADVRVDVAMGVAAAADQGADGRATTAEGLLLDAAAALRVARRGEPGNAVVWDADLRRSTDRRHRIEEALRGAEARGELVLDYQPIVRLDDRRITGVEALLRWEHPQHGRIAPGEFVPLAEETGLIVPIGRWVLREACRQVASWQRRHPTVDLVRASVNVSPAQLDHPGIVDDVRDAIDASGIVPRTLTLEITESSLRGHVHDARQVLGRLKQLGVRLAVDDFGTGWSSLAHLSELPVDVLKIDRSFVVGASADHDHRPAALMRAIVEMGRSLGLETVAEGIEDRAQLERSREMACDHGQGYWFARPTRGLELEPLIAAR